VNPTVSTDQLSAVMRGLFAKEMAQQHELQQRIANTHLSDFHEQLNTQVVPTVSFALSDPSVDLPPKRVQEGGPRRAPEGSPKRVQEGNPKRAPEGSPKRASEGGRRGAGPAKPAPKRAPEGAKGPSEAGGKRGDPASKRAESEHPGAQSRPPRHPCGIAAPALTPGRRR
jgi:hypothetical protein